MAAAGKLPSAAKIGRIWTFDESMLRNMGANEKDPRNLYLRNGIYWARIIVKGRQYRRSLQTKDLNVAKSRLVHFRRQLHGNDNPRENEVPANSKRVYFIQSGDSHIKIGIAKSVKARHRGLQAAHSLELKILGSIPGGRPLEFALHALFAADRLNGEWFRASDALLDYIRMFAARNK